MARAATARAVHVPARAWWVLRQVGAVLLGVFVYFRVRGLTAARPGVAIDHAHQVLGFERRLGIDVERDVQASSTHHDWLTDLANWVYIWGHWPVIVTVMVWLALRHRTVFLRLRNAMFVSGGIGLVVFATYPLAPPRLTALGYVDTVTERSEAYRLLQPPAFVNPYAAMPSLHVGWDLLVGLAVASAAASVLVRWMGRMMPVLMYAAVVLTANHYVVDGVAGAALALFGLAVAVWWERRDARRQAETLQGLPRPRTAADALEVSRPGSMAS
ncbi:MAG TPA: phosphatase PAP2 family protein [Mycobacteriales bacterium]|nr:phosphatase PAP2 family protein [Mycobacteriales bacterium]